MTQEAKYQPDFEKISYNEDSTSEEKQSLVKTAELDEILEHILMISKGECNITDEMILNVEEDKYQSILIGLQTLHEDLETYKQDCNLKIDAENQLEVLKRKNEELAQFNYIASQDLQEPLSRITSLSAVLKKKYTDKLDEEGDFILDFILDSSKRMSSLIFDLLNYARIGKYNNLEELDCMQILNGVLFDLDYVIKKTNLQINIGFLPNLIGNRAGLHQVFQNLIGNALKFRDSNDLSILDISVQSDNDKHVFCIKDNSIGFDPKHRERIFGIFQRLHTQEEYNGKGIGLALCKKIIEMHKGEIWVESESGVGSAFYFSIPKNL